MTAALDVAPVSPWTCAVCGKRPAVKADAVPGVPAAVFPYCAVCSEAMAHPYDVLVNHTAREYAGRLDAAPAFWRDAVARTLRHLEISPDDFRYDVAAEMVRAGG